MPCDTVRTNTVDLEKIPNLDLLEKALRSEFKHVIRRGDAFAFSDREGYTDVRIVNGKAVSNISTEALQTVVGRVKQAYTRTVIQAATKRYGWTIEKTQDVNEFYVVKG